MKNKIPLMIQLIFSSFILAAYLNERKGDFPLTFPIFVFSAYLNFGIFGLSIVLYFKTKDRIFLISTAIAVIYISIYIILSLTYYA
ncbi:MAG: hypothetical protein A2Y65_01755 [Deltaproteobacteria bacterium RBG_13_52_11]|nr:MAG: hypothetical protein A2Y65_01755 [Deltaproteobacteria bacterium RBG_13_52_11]